MGPSKQNKSRKYSETQSPGLYPVSELDAYDLCTGSTTPVSSASNAMSYDSRYDRVNTASYQKQTFRVRGIHKRYGLRETHGLLQEIFGMGFDNELYKWSLAVDATDLQNQVAIVSFKSTPTKLLDYSETNFPRAPNCQEWQFDLPVYPPNKCDSQHDLPRSYLSIDTDFIGITSLYTPESEAHTVDIIAIPGLGGHAYDSWRENYGQYMWLRDSIPLNLPSARVMIYGYNSRPNCNQSSQDIKSIAKTLVTDLQEIIRLDNPRPMIFIAHSLGGLIVKQALIEMKKGSLKSQQILYSTYGVLFFGVPNHGMDIQSLIPLVSKEANENFLHSLGPESQFLQHQSRQFLEAFNFGDSEIVCFYEAKTSPSPSNVQMNGQSTTQRPSAILVPSASAMHCRSWEMEENLQPINKSHMNLVKFSRNDHDYRIVRMTLKRFTERASEMLATREPPPLEDLLRKQIHTWLSPPDPSQNHKRALESRKLNTGTWLTESSTFRAWIDIAGSFIWIHGIPGCGKTVLSATIIKFIADYFRCDRTPTLAYFYFDFNDKEKQTREHLLRSLISQLMYGKPKLSDSLKMMYERVEIKKSTPTFIDLRDIFSLMVEELSSLYLVIDALDESTEQSSLLSWLAEFFRENYDHIHLIVTSRQERTIQQHLGNDSKVQQVEMKSLVVDPDIRMFVDYQLNQHPELRDIPLDLKEEVAEQLIDRADGMFRWVACQVDVLKDCTTYCDVRSTLSSMPTTLDETYARILRGIHPSFQKDAVRIFQWLICAKVPLRLNEIAEILIAEPGEHDRVDPSKRLMREHDILKYCGNLVATQEPSQRDLESDTYGKTWPSSSKELRLAHFSVEEYLLSYRITQDCSIFHIEKRVANFSVTGTCLNYLQYVSNQIGSLELPNNFVDEFPLTPYAAQYWPHHLKLADPEEKFYALSNRVAQFMSNQGMLDHCLQLYNFDRSVPNQVSNFDIGIADGMPLYYCSTLGLSSVGEVLLNGGANVNACGGQYGNALQAAACNGHETVVQKLMDYGADVQAQGGRYNNALVAATDHGHEAIVRLLLERGADVNAKGGEQGNSLSAAVYRGHVNIVRLLLAYGADVNAQAGYYGNALQAGMFTGKEHVVRLLLDSGADINAEGGYFGTSLQAATYYGHKDAVKLLLEHGASVNSQGGYFGTALHIAAEYGLEAILVLLLDHGADVHAQGGFYGSVLKSAVIGRHDAIVKILKDAGAVEVGDGTNELENATEKLDQQLTKTMNPSMEAFASENERPFIEFDHVSRQSREYC